MRLERSRGLRALSTAQQRKHLRLVTNPADDRGPRDTDRVSGSMVAAEEIKTSPDNARPELPPPARAALSAKELRDLPGFSEDQFLHLAMVSVTEAAEIVKRQQADFAALDRDLTGHFETQTAAIGSRLDANYKLVLEQYKHVTERLDSHEGEIHELKRELAQLKEHVAKLEAKLERLQPTTENARPAP